MKMNREKTLKRLRDFRDHEIEFNKDEKSLQEELHKIDHMIEVAENYESTDEQIRRVIGHYGYMSNDVPVME